MKRIFCPHCDGPIVLTPARIAKARAADGRLSVVCPTCSQQLNARLSSRSAVTRKMHENERAEMELRRSAPASLRVVENSFAYAQTLKLFEGVNTIGRRNKDSKVDLPILSADPSMDRRHCIIRAEEKNDGQWLYILKDDESRVGTFLYGRILSAREQIQLEDGAVITLGATTLLFVANEDEQTNE